MSRLIAREYTLEEKGIRPGISPWGEGEEATDCSIKPYITKAGLSKIGQFPADAAALAPA